MVSVDGPVDIVIGLQCDPRLHHAFAILWLIEIALWNASIAPPISFLAINTTQRLFQEFT
ncbi:MAG TPA: hypothetical protein VKM55_29955 [Candidatus Lokiarchaeia archaeon]|nr:hypothetical protein [Candidatus Lokiarchaeia archaeon]